MFVKIREWLKLCVHAVKSLIFNCNKLFKLIKYTYISIYTQLCAAHAGSFGVCLLLRIQFPHIHFPTRKRIFLNYDVLKFEE